jgi:hypothetical protein
MSSLKVYLILLSSIYFVSCESSSEEILKIPADDESDPGVGLREERFRWPKIKGSVIVPYDFGNFSENEMQTILLAMRTMETETNCIKFVRRTDQQDYVFFQISTTCSSLVGREGGVQTIDLTTDCVDQSSILHELTHALGFFHEHCHPNRDQYVTINRSNIIHKSPFIEPSIKKVEAIHCTSFNTPYDFDSIMHSPSNMFGTLSIVRNDGVNGGIIAENKKLSVGDITRIRRMYKCEESTDKDDVVGNLLKQLYQQISLLSTLKSTKRSFKTNNINEA